MSPRSGLLLEQECKANDNDDLGWKSYLCIEYSSYELKGNHKHINECSQWI